jgi:DNA-binding XRE family transcriptional regulator
VKSDNSQPVHKHVERLLYSREQTAEALGGVSNMTIVRLENDRKLRKVRLRGGAGKVFHLVEDVLALLQERLGNV